MAICISKLPIGTLPYYGNLPVGNLPIDLHHIPYYANLSPAEIDFDKINTITRLIFLTAWEIANRDERIKLRDDL